MVTRKKNLLEAFQASALQGPRAAASKDAGAPSTQRGDRPIRSFAPVRPRSGFASALSHRTVQVALVLLVLTIGGAYWLGRRNATSVAAAAPAADEGIAPGALLPSHKTAAAIPAKDVAAANVQTAQSGSADDQAFMDPKNRYTIRLIQYTDDGNGRAAASALHEHLRKKEAVPVISPISKGKAVILVAGSAPKIKDLDPLLAHIRSLRGPNPADDGLPFKDAYVVNIDDLVQRRP